MTKIRLGALLVWLFCLPLPAGAQERRELALEGEETPVEVFADRIESLERERLVIAEGRVEIQQGATRLEADRVEVNTETGEAVAQGRVLFFDGRDRLLGERLEYSFRSGTGVIFRGEGQAEPHFFFSGDRLERFAEKAYRVTGGVFTTCEAETPAWSVRWGEATAYLDDYVWGTNASFWVWKIPVIPFIPVFYANLRKDRQTGFLRPSFGSSNTKGFTYRQPFFWAISDSQDLTLTPSIYTKQGYGLGAEYRYIRRETSRGAFDGFGLYDTDRDEPRGVVSLRHDEQITPRLSLKADLGFVSDDDFFGDFDDSLDERSRQRLESNLSLTQSWDSSNLVLQLFAYQDLTTGTAVELHRLPQIRYNAFQQPLPWFKDLLWEFEGSYTNFVRDVGADGQRLDLRPRLSLPFSPGGYFTVTPRIGLRETLYDARVVGTKVVEGFTIEDTDADLVAQTRFEASVDLEARAFRNFDAGGSLGIQRLQHAIEPRISYNFISDVSQSRVPQFDGTDAILDTNGVTYSLTNRVKARAVGTEDRPGRVWELARLTFAQTYDVHDDGSRKQFSDLLADLILEPVYGLRFRGSTSIDPYGPDIRTATTDLIYRANDWLLAVGTRHGQGGELQFVQGSLQARLGRHWSARVSTNFDVDSSTIVENRFEVDYREQCWAVTVSVVNRTDEDEVHVAINLLELGHFGFGRGLTAQ